MPARNPCITDKRAKAWMLYGIPVVFIIGGLTHFTFELSGENPFVGILSPVNESVWEHLKMSFWPLFIWWLLGYLPLSKRDGFSAASWFSSCAAALYLCQLFIVSFFYTYTGALGTESLIVDIISMLFGLTAAQVLAYHMYRFGRFKKSCLIYSMFAIALLTAAFIVFTFAPPHIPLFIDPNTGLYGI